MEPFSLGYAYEALARAESLAGNRDAMSAHLAEARRDAGRITDAETKKMLLSDLETIQKGRGQFAWHWESGKRGIDRL